MVDNNAAMPEMEAPVTDNIAKNGKDILVIQPDSRILLDDTEMGDVGHKRDEVDEVEVRRLFSLKSL